MQNKVFLDENGFVHAEYVGHLTYEKVTETQKEINALVEKMRKEDKRALVLVDISKVSGQDMGARRAGFEGMSKIKYDKIALFGAGIFLKNVVNFVVKAAGKSGKVRLFTTEKEAGEWLKS